MSNKQYNREYRKDRRKIKAMGLFQTRRFNMQMERTFVNERKEMHHDLYTSPFSSQQR